MLFNLYGVAYTLSTASRTQRLPLTYNNKQHVLICTTFVSYISINGNKELSVSTVQQ